jgi:flavin-dependent dehydrogenase
MSSAQGPVAVVGAGPSGLGCAIELAAQVPVILVDRIPVLGGTAGWDRSEVRSYGQRLAALGVETYLGHTAIRWSGERLLVVGPGTCRSVSVRQLFLAAGLRPATVAELQVTGDRPAGVLPATVAEHLLEAGLPLWQTVVIVGQGAWATRVADQAASLGSRVVALGNTALRADEYLDRPDHWSIVGRDRPAGSASVEVPCDAVVLAADPVPNRNVDGAVLAGSPGVTFVQPTAPGDLSGRFSAARRAAAEWLSATREADST